jgi:hypothetical protein
LGDCLLEQGLCKKTEEDQIVGLLFSTVKGLRKFWQKMSVATFWAIFSQTLLVALAEICENRQAAEICENRFSQNPIFAVNFA